MSWKPEDPQGDEAAKVRYDLLPYIGASGIDLGCGPRKVFEHFVGVDNGLDTQLFNIPMRPDMTVATCERMPAFADGAFDTVFSSHLLEHIEHHEAALAEWWRLVRPGGTLILYLPHADLYPNIGQPGANPDHKHDFRNADIVAAMERVASDWDLEHDEVRDQLREYSFLQVYRKTAPGSGHAHSHAKPRPAKTAGICRPGAYGDALWGGSVAAALKAEGYHVTMFTGPQGEEVLRHDPNIDRIVVFPKGLNWSDDEWLLYYLWQSKKFDRWANLIGIVESSLLPHPNEVLYYLPHPVRHARMNQNYLEALHDAAQLPHRFSQRFHPSPEERAWAAEQRRKLFPGPLVVIAPAGSGAPKTWPHTQGFMDRMAAAGVYTLVLGEIRQELVPPETYGCVIGKELPIRLAMALALTAEVVVGTESAIVNAVAMEDNLKVVLLSHSSAENLTKHWRNTWSVEPQGLGCHPCHRLHRGFEFCVRHPDTGFSACQSAATAEAIAAPVLEYLERQRKREAA